MFKQKRLTVLSMAVLLALLVAAVKPFAALADDSAPPPPDAPVVGEPPAEAPVVDEPSAEAPVVDEPVASEPSADVPAVDAAPTEEPVVDAAPTDVPAVDEPLTVPEILDAAPDGTDLVVLDENGQPLALASEAAAETLFTGDPVWCPAGKKPGDTGCTASGITTVADLITALGTINAGSKATGAGTIYFTSTYSTNDASLDPTVYTNLSGLTDLTIQGGWNGSLNGSGYGLSGVTTFNHVPLSITNWTGYVTLNDIVITGASGDGLTVLSNGSISLTSVIADGNGSDGAHLDNTSGPTTTTVTVDNSKITSGDGFSFNGYWGLFVSSKGAITLINVNADNDGYGAYLYNKSFSGAGGISINPSGGASSFSNNPGYGLWAVSNGPISLTNVTANGNDWSGDGSAGAYLANGSPTASAITVNNSIFGDSPANGNNEFGLEAFSQGTISLSGVTASGNMGGYGAYLDSSLGSGNVSVGPGFFNNNGYVGLVVKSNGTVTLSDVTANNNFDGADLTGASISITNSHFDGNWTRGISLITGGIGNAIADCNSTANNNHGYGVYLNVGTFTNGFTLSGNGGLYTGSYHTLINTICNPGGGGGTSGGSGSDYRNKNKVLSLPQVLAVTTPCTLPELPGVLPEGKTFAACMSVKLTLGGEEIEEAPAGVQASFDIPAGMEPPFTVLSWNGTAWVEVPSSVVDGKVVFSVTGPGKFVLVSP